MATSAINIDQDHPRWEEYKFDRLRHPSIEDDIDKNPYPQRYDKGRANRPRRSLVKKEGQSNVAFKGELCAVNRYACVLCTCNRPRRSLVKKEGESNAASVSYTHLTLPTKLPV